MRLGIEEDSVSASYKTEINEQPRLMHSSDAVCFLGGMNERFTDYNTDGKEWVTINRTIDGSARIDAVDLKDNTVPNVIGMNITDAIYLLENQGIKATFTGEGIVSEQSLHPGDTLRGNRSMELKLARK